LFLELDRDDDPQLYDDLMRFRKGPKRVSRLRLLAHDGLQQRGTSDSNRTSAADAARQGSSTTAEVKAAHLTSHAFDATRDDDVTP
jgi:hypothetical protein